MDRSSRPACIGLSQRRLQLPSGLPDVHERRGTPHTAAAGIDLRQPVRRNVDVQGFNLRTCPLHALGCTGRIKAERPSGGVEIDCAHKKLARIRIRANSIRYETREEELFLFVAFIFLDVLAGFLINDFHRQANLATVIKAHQLHIDFVAFGNDVLGMRDALILHL